MKKIQISIYILAPFIFGIFSLFSFLVSFQITDYSYKHQTDPVFFLLISGIFISGLSALIGYYIIRLVLKPAEAFIEKIKKSPAVQANAAETDDDAECADPMEAYSKIFAQVAHALDIVDTEKFFPEIAGTSQAMRQVLSQVIKVAPTDSTVLILGESGTGKELIARGIVRQSARKDGPFIKINCAAISSGLMESELFGHEKGAFTGAVSRKKGCFEQADSGTLFLDEIGDMPLALQVKLLRVLQEKELNRVGGSTAVPVNVRIIAATHKDIEKLIAKGQFREDLFYRLNVFPITLPPLRKRKEDIRPLADHFLSLAGAEKRIDPDALLILEKYDWPGNIRELENIIERATVLAGDQAWIRPGHLSEKIKTPEALMLPSGAAMGGAGKKKLSLDETVRQIEKSLICTALEKSRGVQARAAEELGINQRSLWNRIKKFEINAGDFKD